MKYTSVAFGNFCDTVTLFLEENALND
ncbi:hypothetical protein AGR1C_pAt40355 [Agrobacterium fabacearum TT111]|nr:hypothetical protein AGR1C_pAt40355 [Agrobacterium fabacearum TT111]